MMHDIIKKQLAPLLATNENTDKVWVFQSSTEMEEDTMLHIEKAFDQHQQTWQTHGNDVQSKSALLLHRFFIVIAKEVSGCSTDSLFHFVKKIEQQFAISFFNRNILCFWQKGKVVSMPSKDFHEAYHKNNSLESTDYFFDNTVSTLQKLKTNWLTPISESWLIKNLSE